MFSSSTYTQDMKECMKSLKNMRAEFKEHMNTLTSNLYRLISSDKGKVILSYLNDMLQKLNFNGYYINKND